MLCINTYPQDYVDACRARFDAQLADYRRLVSAARSNAQTGKTLEAFEPQFFNNLLLALEASFVHRSRTIEGRDGNPLNEVRVLCNSILSNDGVLTAEKSIKLSPERSVLKLEFGDEIRLGEAEFGQLTKAFFAELENKFV